MHSNPELTPKVKTYSQECFYIRSKFSWDRFPGKLPWKMKELVSAVSFSRTHSWKHRTSSCPLKVRKVGGIRDSLGLNVSFCVCSKPKEKRTRDGKPIEKYKGIARGCRCS